MHEMRSRVTDGGTPADGWTVLRMPLTGFPSYLPQNIYAGALSEGRLPLRLGVYDYLLPVVLSLVPRMPTPNLFQVCPPKV